MGGLNSGKIYGAPCSIRSCHVYLLCLVL